MWLFCKIQGLKFHQAIVNVIYQATKTPLKLVTLCKHDM